MWWGWALVAVVALAYGAFTKRLANSIVTGPMVFVLLGLLVSDWGFDLVKVDLDGDVVKALFKMTLALLLFVEASHTRVRLLQTDAGWVVRLLLLTMPLVIILGTVAASLLFEGVSIWEAAILAVILAPTDSALGTPVVTNKAVPGRVRRTLIAESGLNDGLALPFALIFTGAALVDLGLEVRGDAIEFVLQQVGFGVMGGLVLGALAGWIVAWALNRGHISRLWVNLAPIAAAVLAYSGTEAIEGNGFVAVWVAGLLYGWVLRQAATDGSFAHFSEDLTGLLVPASFFVFGATMLGQALDVVTWEMVVFGLVSLVLVRPFATLIGFLGDRAGMFEKLFIGWFGPRGIASIIIAAIVVKEAGLGTDDVIVSITSIAVALSVYLHGATAAPGARWFASRVDSEESAV